MQLSASSAVNLQMVTDRNGGALDSKEFSGCSSIDLTIRSLITRSDDGNPIKDFDELVIKGVSLSIRKKIKPQETVYLISEERINVPAGYVAYVFLKNRFSQKGLLAFNTGIVDGGYNGPIATLLTNISAQSIDLSSVNGGKFFRVVFHKIKMDKKDSEAVIPQSYKYDDYLKYKAIGLLELPQYFQNPDKIREQIERSLNQKALNYGFLRLGLIIGVAGFIMVMAPPLTQLVTDKMFGSQPLNKEVWEVKNQEIDLRMKKIETKLKSLNFEINDTVDEESVTEKADNTG